MRSELKDLHLRLGATMVYVTHDQGEAMTLSDTIAVMSGGRIEQLGAPRALYERPANLFVARFLGEPGMNVFEGVVEAGGFAAAGVALRPPSSLAPGSRKVCAGIRPEQLALVPLATAAIRGRARTVEFLGARALLRLDVGAQVAAAFVTLDAAIAPGDEIGLARSLPIACTGSTPRAVRPSPRARSSCMEPRCGHVLLRGPRGPAAQTRRSQKMSPITTPIPPRGTAAHLEAQRRMLQQGIAQRQQDEVEIPSIDPAQHHAPVAQSRVDRAHHACGAQFVQGAPAARLQPMPYSGAQSK
jgi:hypothetical protein